MSATHSSSTILSIADSFLNATELINKPELLKKLGVDSSSFTDNSDNKKDPKSLKDRLKALEKKIKNGELQLSDVTDSESHQYVDLVMEGGAMLGLSLVGYTFALESMGLRFYSIAGTSAGAINASCLVAWNGKSGNFSSEWVLEKVAEKIRTEDEKGNKLKGFFDFVDIGDAELESLVNQAVKENLAKYKNYPDKKIKVKEEQAKKIDLISSFAELFDGEDILEGWGSKLVILASDLLGKFDEKIKTYSKVVLKINKKEGKEYRRGLCKGDTFRKWIEELVTSQNVNLDSDKDDFIEKRNTFLQKQRLQFKDSNDEPEIGKYFTDKDFKIIVTDITTARKATFPKDSELYGIKSPIDYIRASMSVPFFFTPVEQEIPAEKRNNKAWEEEAEYYGKPPDKVTFIDGGVLSNFPINAFHLDNDSIAKRKSNKPCRPTFGVKLGKDFITQSPDEDNKNVEDNRQECFQADNIISLTKSMMETLRLSNEREFLGKNKDYQQLIKCIDVDEDLAFNFDMSQAEQQYLFWAGYKAAIEFVEKKENNWWKNYQTMREGVIKANENNEVPIANMSQVAVGAGV
ncbi:MAG: patatin-like phospholipase family protein [Candidatus Melainabacteria bacterium]